MITTTHYSFLQVLSDYIACKRTLDTGCDLEDIAIKHQLAAIVYYQCRTKTLQNIYLQQVANYVRRKKVVEELEKQLQNYKHIFFKGAEIAELYPQPALRSMGDIDVLIDEKDIDCIHDKLIKSGFELLEQSGIVWMYKKAEIIFELHTKLIHPEYENDCIINYFHNPWNFTKGSKLDWNFHFILLLVHLRHHLVSEGAGVRQFMDIAIVTKECNLDWKWIVNEVKKLDLFDFISNILQLNEKWFGVISPIRGSITESFYERITDFILANGVFGHNNPFNANSDISRSMIIQGKSIHRVSISYFFKEAFPPYVIVEKLPYCSYVKNKKFLLPVAWIHRFCYRIFNIESRNEFKIEFLIKSVEQRRKFLC